MPTIVDPRLNQKRASSAGIGENASGAAWSTMLAARQNCHAERSAIAPSAVVALPDPVTDWSAATLSRLHSAQ